LFRASLRGM